MQEDKHPQLSAVNFVRRQLKMEDSVHIIGEVRMEGDSYRGDCSYRAF